MCDASSHRWLPGVLTMRWRHVFWISPLVGMVLGLGIHFVFFHRSEIKTEIKTVIMVRDHLQAHVDSIHSNTILVPVVRELDLAQYWHLSEDAAIGRVRANLRQSTLEGTNISCISFHEFDPMVAVKVPPAVVRQIGIQLDEWQKEKIEASSRSGEWMCSIPFSSDLIHEEASLSQTYPSLRQKPIHGFCSGVLLTAPLAYLLECLFPRRRTMNKCTRGKRYMDQSIP